jgi:hypothetical protein
MHRPENNITCQSTRKDHDDFIHTFSPIRTNAEHPLPILVRICSCSARQRSHFAAIQATNEAFRPTQARATVNSQVLFSPEFIIRRKPGPFLAGRLSHTQVYPGEVREDTKDEFIVQRIFKAEELGWMRDWRSRRMQAFRWRENDWCKGSLGHGKPELNANHTERSGESRLVSRQSRHRLSIEVGSTS